MQQLIHQADIARNQALGTNGRRVYSTVATDVKCLFLPMSDRAAEQRQYSIGMAWFVYFDPGTDVKTGDKLTYGGEAYYVRGVKRYDAMPFVAHIECAVTSEAATNG